MDPHHEMISLPEIFWSFETGKPIEHCSMCNRELMASGTNYLIEKAFNKGETIFEHALCRHCYTEANESLSEERRERIQAYFSEHVDLNQRQNTLTEQHGTHHKKWIGHCMVKGFPVREVDEYQLFGFCIDKDLVFRGAPYALCGDVIEEILELLSSETLGVMNAISEKLFDINAPKGLLVLQETPYTFPNFA